VLGSLLDVDGSFLRPVSRRRFLQLAASSAALAACTDPVDPIPSASPSNGPTRASTRPSPPTASPAHAVSRTLYRETAIADGRSQALQQAMSILVEDGRIRWIRPADAEEDPGPGPLELVDASGTTAVPGMVDCHSHLTGPGGARWIDRFSDPTERLLEVAERNGPLLSRSGVRWARDVGAPVRPDPTDGRQRALNLGLRDRWKARPELPYIRAAGSWVTRAGILPDGLSVEAADAGELRAAAVGQLDDGADLVKLYVNGVEPEWSAAQMRPVVEAAHARGRPVTAHAVHLAGARACVEAGVDAIEHGFEIDAELARLMAEREVALVSTLTVFRSRITFTATTALERFAGQDARRGLEERLEQAAGSVRAAHAAGVAVCAGTDFGGGSPRAGQLAWEVESLVAAGLEPFEALAAATWRGGELLGEADAGVISEGGPADFFLVHGDPLSDPASLWRVWRVAWTA
jgi:imidazolonepropionase-like amidohydrolase